MKDFILNKFKPNFDGYMQHTQHDFLPATNITMENYFGVSFPRHLKKIYKTESGVTMYLDFKREMGGKSWKNLNYHVIFDTPKFPNY
ncbi:MAG: hypothetical protein LBT10_03650 [Methanobrevibacter sp.]|nr:hypothetical protein [Methanobrevibacter sp.]